MINTADIRKMSSLSDEAREALVGAFDALTNWRDETAAANYRCLEKVLDEMAAAQREMGWPNEFNAQAREHLFRASKMQTQMIDQVMDVWEQQLKSKGPPWVIQGTAAFGMPRASGAGGKDPTSEMMQFWELMFAPYKLWVQAWQRACVPSEWEAGTQRSRSFKKAA